MNDSVTIWRGVWPWFSKLQKIDRIGGVVSRATTLMPAVQDGSQEPHVLFRLNLKPSFSITLAIFQVLSSHMWCEAMGSANTMVLFILAAPLHWGPWARAALAVCVCARALRRESQPPVICGYFLNDGGISALILFLFGLLLPQKSK